MMHASHRAGNLVLILFLLFSFSLAAFEPAHAIKSEEQSGESPEPQEAKTTLALQPSKSTEPLQSENPILQWMEKHPVATPFLGVLFGAVAVLIAALITKPWMPKRKAARLAEAAKEAELAVEQREHKKTQDQNRGDAERRYLEGVESEHGSIRLYGFQSGANVPVRTLEVFVSLRLEHSRISDRQAEVIDVEVKEDLNHLSPEEILRRAFHRKRLLLIRGDPGSGKTTLLKYYALCCQDEAGRRKLGFERPVIPILLPLRKVNAPDEPFSEVLSTWATAKNRPVTAEMFDDWLDKQGCLVMLDGLDEIRDDRDRSQVCEWIDNACSAYKNSRFVVTSRQYAYNPRKGVELRTDHDEAWVHDLNPEQQATFLKNWFAAVYRDEKTTSSKSDAEREDDVKTAADEVAKAVLNYLNKKENKGLRRLAGTPVLLQIMAILWREFGSLAAGRATLYEKCIDYLLDYRDREKDLEPLLPAEDTKIVLRPTCLWIQEQQGKEDVSKAEFEDHISGRLEEVKTGLTAKLLRQNLRDRTGLLQDFGDDSLTFRHRSFREYLGATQLAEEVQRQPDRAQVLVDHFADDWWRETLVFSLSLPKPVIFTDFMAKFLPHKHNADGFPVLLGQLVQEARRKPVAAFETFLPNRRYQWQKRYNALECLRLIGSDPAKDLVKKVWEKEQKGQVKTKARELLELWKLREPQTEPEIITGLASSWRNPHELDAEYILIPGGRYNYSVNGESVEVASIYFAKYPVTNKQFRRFIDYLAGTGDQELSARLPMERYTDALLNTVKEVKGFKDYMGADRTELAGKLRSGYHDDRRFNGNDQPVVGTSWFAAVAYCRWLTELENTSRQQSEQFIYRLPSEMEWEWAASGGEREYPWGSEKPVENRANFGKNVGQTTSVGAYPAGATPEGLMDMAGNVWEWMENWYGKDQNLRALRGGSWYGDSVSLRCAARDHFDPGDNWGDYGFRVVRCQS